MLKKLARDYLSFSQRERVAVFVLLLLIFAIFILPYLLPVPNSLPDPAKLAAFRDQARALSQQGNAGDGEPDKKFLIDHAALGNRKQRRSYDEEKMPVPGKLFYFDPNTLDAAGWQKLGLRERTAGIIRNYVLKGGKFRKAEELARIYSLRREDLQRLLPYVKIREDPSHAASKSWEPDKPVTDTTYKFSGRRSYPTLPVDVNKADSTAFVALPGIGPRLATRIIKFRDRLGGFYSADQLADVFGLPDSTFQLIRPRLTITEKEVQRININTADVNELRQLVYLGWNEARAIVDYRGTHGNFRSIDDLNLITIIPSALLKKIGPYLRVE